MVVNVKHCCVEVCLVLYSFVWPILGLLKYLPTQRGWRQPLSIAPVLPEKATAAVVLPTFRIIHFDTIFPAAETLWNFPSARLEVKRSACGYLIRGWRFKNGEGWRRRFCHGGGRGRPQLRPSQHSHIRSFTSEHHARLVFFDPLTFWKFFLSYPPLCRYSIFADHLHLRDGHLPLHILRLLLEGGGGWGEAQS